MPRAAKAGRDGWEPSPCGRYLNRVIVEHHVTRDGKPYTSHIYESESAPGFIDPNREISGTRQSRKRQGQQG